MNGILTYLIIGTIWTAYFEYNISPNEMTNSARIRQILLWFIPAGAFVIGFIIGFIKTIENFLRNL